ncbi:MAG: TetR/AcrR family transcriptional regulator [Caulobacterales bacterium]|jgi:AcrR family transcriptional regulator
MKGSETHQKLIEAVIAVVFENGYAGATMARIAERAGVTRGAIQHHFGDTRVDLMAAACAEVLEHRQQQYEASLPALANADLDSAREGLKAAYRDPGTWFLLEVWIASKSDDALRARVEDYLGTERSIADEALGRMLQSLGERQMDFAVYKHTMRALTRGLALEYAHRPDTEFLDQVVDFVMDAVSSLLRQKRE